MDTLLHAVHLRSWTPEEHTERFALAQRALSTWICQLSYKALWNTSSNKTCTHQEQSRGWDLRLWKSLSHTLHTRLLYSPSKYFLSPVAGQVFPSEFWRTLLPEPVISLRRRVVYRVASRKGGSVGVLVELDLLQKCLPPPEDVWKISEDCNSIPGTISQSTTSFPFSFPRKASPV